MKPKKQTKVIIQVDEFKLNIKNNISVWVDGKRLKNPIITYKVINSKNKY